MIKSIENWGRQSHNLRKLPVSIRGMGTECLAPIDMFSMPNIFDIAQHWLSNTHLKFDQGEHSQLNKLDYQDYICKTKI